MPDPEEVEATVDALKSERATVVNEERVLKQADAGVTYGGLTGPIGPTGSQGVTGPTGRTGPTGPAA